VGLLNTEPEKPSSRAIPIVVISVVIALALCAVGWLYFAQRRAAQPLRTFDNAELGCRFEFASNLASGPNFVRTPHGAFLTIERHSLFEADPAFVAGLPEVLFAQVRIQLNESYAELEELARRESVLGGRPALHVELRGHAGGSAQLTRIAIDIAATDEWVWVLRAYYSESSGPEDEAALEHVRATMSFTASPAAATTR
jgi:hypothetical protein